MIPFAKLTGTPIGSVFKNEDHLSTQFEILRALEITSEELSSYCLSIVDTSSDDLHNAFLSMVDVGTAIKEGMATKLVAIKEEVAGQSDTLFPSDRRRFDAVGQRRETLYAQ